ncbi:3-deoxy-manno-octulosonate cytidylyltransferase [Puniceicoccus vermicola]|uniref:3-deoxy-manno-octulosonate cytidylyltransferase n=1 Tax=Puniceicoccus vermicola TaxID=388746 RepID=UPI0031B59DCA
MSIPKAIIVPARLESVRFPRKLLYVVRGEPLILHTARQVNRAAPDCPLYFAVADQELADVLEAEGFHCVLTDPSLASGTDRIAFANREIGAERVVNVQADEPLVSKNQIELLFELLEGGAEMSTLAIRLEALKRFKDPNQVKVVRGLQGRALYFSRAPIPWDRESAGNPDGPTMDAIPVLGHLGLYGYRASFLEKFVSLEPSPLEQIERLEQLRALENGAEIQVGLTEERTVGVDTPEDVGRLEAALDELDHG